MTWLAILCGIVLLMVGFGALLLFLAGLSLREVEDEDWTDVA